MRTIYALVAFCWLATGPINAWGNAIQNQAWDTAPACPGSGRLVVLSGQLLAPLLGAPIHKLSILRASVNGLTPVTFQVDRKDVEGRYIIDEATAATDDIATLDLDDELVVRATDVGMRLGSRHRQAQMRDLVELRLGGSADAKPGWLYASVSGQAAPGSAARQIEYDPESDAVQSATYRAGFSRQWPFLVDSFEWKLAGSRGWSPDVIDTMKIRHSGYFLGFIPFRRTQRDYTSTLTAVKTGPLRTIRRTENRVRMFWGLKTPVVYIDYIMLPDGFVMDTIVDIPFDVGLFFSEIETLTTVDWSENAGLPRLTVHEPQRRTALYVDGVMSDEEHDVNLLQADRFAVTSSLGVMLVGLDIPAGVPITPWLYFRDLLDVADPPEHRPGQFGNVGFRTTGWEQIDTEVQHMKFTVCLATRDQDTREAGP